MLEEKTEGDAGPMASMPMSKLLEGIAYETRGADDTAISGIAYASGKVVAGDAFFCVKGIKSDGHDYAADAVARGAVALVVERTLPVDVPQFVVRDSRLALALASATFFGHPTSSMQVVGITGTNGKTTTANLVEWIAMQAGRTTGIIGTIETRYAGNRIKAEHTTPESLDLQKLFADMRDAGVGTVVMEVSSHAVDLDRIAGTQFAVAAFSNLTQDHLDYHHTMEAYFQAKRRLFTEYRGQACAICVNDEYGRRMADAARGTGHRVLTCGFLAGADLRAIDIRCTAEGTSFTILEHDVRHPVTLDLVGRFNVENALLAITTACLMGIPLDKAAEAMSAAPQVPGRLERVKPGKPRPFSVLVDYCHTPDAIDKALAVVRDIAKGRVIIVFGCGGDRDKGKRPRMGESACAADYAIVTSDNPRTEDPAAIIDDILPGMERAASRMEVVPDRREAIRRAVSMASDGDCVLIAGKGHEDYQLVGDKVLAFDDRKVAAEEMDAL